MSIRKYKIRLLMVRSSTLTEEKSFDTKYKLLEPFELNEWKHFDIWIYWFVTFEWKLRSVGIEWPFKWNWMFQTIFKMLRHRVVSCVKSFASRMSINSNSFVYTYTHTRTQWQFIHKMNCTIQWFSFLQQQQVQIIHNTNLPTNITHSYWTVRLEEMVMDLVLCFYV